ncbi:MAG: DUF1254 domain-containing protein [Dehalococcoidia bacterium]|nr:DUF1254 domain-containing protein [Dehalococcoidia bacterium]
MNNTISHRFLILNILLIIVCIVAIGCANTVTPDRQTVSPQETQQIAYNATVYGFPLVIMDLTRQVMTAVPSTTANGAPVNQFGNKKTFPDASFTNVVNPNADTLYSSAWVDTDKEPVILSLPDTHGRYYLMPMLNYWTDSFASPGSRTTGTIAGNYAITGPNWSGKLPEGIPEMRSSTRWVWIVGRIACTGSSDYENVWKLQDQLKLTPLSAWGTNYVPPTDVPVDPNVNTKVSPLNQLLALNAAGYFNYVCQLMVENPPYEADAPLLAEMATIGIKPGIDYTSYYAGLDDGVKSAIQAGYQSALDRIPAEGMGDIKNGWQLPYGTGDYGTDYTLRAAIAYRGLGANLVDDAFYASASTDGDGTIFSSDNKYVLHFSKDEIPPVNGFWSLSMYNEKILFASNPINRYCLGSLSDPPLIKNPDGSIDIYIQRDSPDAARIPNWLPAPAGGGFSLTLRLYWPQKPVIDKSWIPPAVQMIK